MIIELCRCDWGLGTALPPHMHRHLAKVAKGGRTFWCFDHDAVLNPAYTILADWEDVSLSVDWKTLFWTRRAGPPEDDPAPVPPATEGGPTLSDSES